MKTSSRLQKQNFVKGHNLSPLKLFATLWCKFKTRNHGVTISC